MAPSPQRGGRVEDVVFDEDRRQCCPRRFAGCVHQRRPIGQRPARGNAATMIAPAVVAATGTAVLGGSATPGASGVWRGRCRHRSSSGTWRVADGAACSAYGGLFDDGAEGSSVRMDAVRRSTAAEILGHASRGSAVPEGLKRTAEEILGDKPSTRRRGGRFIQGFAACAAKPAICCSFTRRPLCCGWRCSSTLTRYWIPRASNAAAGCSRWRG